MDNLKSYRDKRNFERTPEPAGEETGSAGGHRYVMHKHAASHDHFDLRLELDGALRSWALPKGASLKTGEKHLAVQVEDHPLEYGDFEGIIPREEYGGGTVMLWDRGQWHRTDKGGGKNDQDRIDLWLDGEKLRGAWTLTRMKGRAGGKDGRNWLLIKRDDDQPEPRPHDRSVLSGRTMKQIGADPDRVWQGRDHRQPDADLKGARRFRGKTLSPQLATLSDTLPEGDWFYEIKFDGYRLLAHLDQGQVRLITRNGKDWSDRFPELSKALAALPIDQAVLDGEVVALLPDGISSFRHLQEALSRGDTDALIYQVFDLPVLGGQDLCAVPNIERKRALEQLLDGAGVTEHGRVRYTDHLSDQGPALMKRICEMGLEGLIAKHARGDYQQRRSKQWLKVKCVQYEEFVVGGFTDPGGSREGFGSLLLGAYDKHGHFGYAGRVGTGFNRRQLKDIHKRLGATEVEQCPFDKRPPDSKGAHWVTPQLVVEVEYTERTRDGVLRHPAFRGLREDRDARGIVWDNPERGGPPHQGPARQGKKRRQGVEALAGAAAPRRHEALVAGVRITHPDRVLYPRQGLTKIELARFYESIASWVLPGLVNRPLSLLRCPEGLASECFFQKHPSRPLPDRLPRVEIEESGGPAEYVYVKELADLVALVQAGVMELHPWGCRVDRVEQPDLMVFDLDPAEDVPWHATVEQAHALGRRLEDLGLVSFVRTTGGKGVHLVVPLRRHADWEEVKAFARAVCEQHARSAPALLTTNMSKARRRGKIFLDYLRNSRGATAIASYSVRARPGAPVAVPLRWDELSEAMAPDRYSVDNLSRRLAALRRDPWAELERTHQRLTVAMKRQLSGR
ncbi:DNA ligase D [Alloalcanivorax mobilis]|uniref:DNA ligase D n=1 Tax=Alloalcanivorax mobilis TaxID=2019569 RepID=UPI000C789656|nr:DNA ligase D [Alloalcanivorax mobilis]